MIQNVLLASCLMLVAAPLAAQEKFDVAGGFTAFEDLFGVVPGKRRNHTKGFCVEGTIDDRTVGFRYPVVISKLLVQWQLECRCAGVA